MADRVCDCGHVYADHWPDGQWCVDEACTCGMYLITNPPTATTVPVRSLPVARVRVEVRPVIDAVPRIPPLGHWWQADVDDFEVFLEFGEQWGPTQVVPAECVVCGERPEAHDA